MGTNADKHARQKDRRSRVDEARRQVELRAKRRKQLSILGGVLALAIVIGVIVALTGGEEDEAADTTTTTASTTTVASDDTTTTEPAAGAPLPAPPPGATLTEDTECPPTEGAPERVVKFAGPPPDCIDPEATYSARISTNKGDIVVALDAQKAPNTVNNFVVLARYRYYDGVPFHRVVPGFVLQAGDGDGDPWGNNDLGYSIEDELPADASEYVDYSLAMANSGPDTNGSQFFIVLPGGGRQLQALYSLFGQVTEGTDVVDAIGALGTPAAAEPSEVVLINSVSITETPAG